MIITIYHRTFEINNLRENKVQLRNTIDSLKLKIQNKDILLSKLGVKENVDSSSDGINQLKDTHYFYYTAGIPLPVYEAAEQFNAKNETE
jgi:hypothetical protein